MLITRKLGKILRGKATRTQVVLAGTLGGMLGFVPGFFLPGDLGGGFTQAPGTILGLLFLAFVLNANLGLFGLTVVIAKLLSFLLLPLSFAVGRWLLDGPLQGAFEVLVNAPVIAWFGLEHYATTGGLALGLVVGLLAGFAFWRLLQAFRRGMANLEEGSAGYQKWAGKRSTKFVAWLLVGGDKRGRLSYRELADREKQGLPVRVWGLAVVAVVVAGLWLGQRFLAGPFAREAMQRSLETANGATTDIAEVLLDLAGAELRIDGLAMADPQELERDNLRARALHIDLGTSDLLRKRFVLERVASSDASHGMPRDNPGKRIGQPPPPPPPPPGEGKTIDDYIAQAKKWKERLQQVNDWLRRVAGSDEEETHAEREERIARERADGLTRVRAEHLLRQAPAVLVRELVFEAVEVADVVGDRFDVRASNLSTNPALVDAPIRIDVTSKSGRYAFSFEVAGGKANVKLGVVGLDADGVGAQLAMGGTPPVRGGTIDFVLEGALGFSAGTGFVVDLPLHVTLRGTTLSLYGLQPTPVEELTIPIGLRGPITNPRITLDDDKLATSLVAAGRKELADQVRSRAAKLLDGVRVPGAGDAVGGAVGDLIEGKKTAEQLAEEAKAAAEAEARKRAEAELEKQRAEAAKKLEEQLKKRGLGGLNDILGGKKKDG